MNISEFRLSKKWLQKEEFSTPRTLTILDVYARNLDDGTKKLTMFFSETGTERGAGLNRTNIDACSQIFKSDETEQWIGGKVELFNDHSVTYQGQRGGLRIRAAPPEVAPAELAAPVAPAVQAIKHTVVREDDIASGGVPDSDIPF